MFGVGGWVVCLTFVENHAPIKLLLPDVGGPLDELRQAGVILVLRLLPAGGWIGVGGWVGRIEWVGGWVGGWVSGGVRCSSYLSR